MRMVTAEQANDIRARITAFANWLGTRTSYKPEDKPADVPDVSNEERSALEVFEFVVNPPTRYFLYIKESTSLATTWTGDELGHVSFGREYRGNFGDRRVPITVRAINGKKYHGTYYKSSGDYARIKVAKN